MHTSLLTNNKLLFYGIAVLISLSSSAIPPATLNCSNWNNALFPTRTCKSIIKNYETQVAFTNNINKLNSYNQVTNKFFCSFTAQNLTNKNFWMSLYYKDSKDSLYLEDGLLTGFDDAYSIQVDNDDVRKFLNSSDNLGIMRFGQQLIVERRPDVYGVDTTLLNLSQTRFGNYKFVTEFENMNIPGFEARLVDKFLNTNILLSLTHSTPIEFNISDAAGSAATDRFLIVYKRAEVRINSVATSRNADRSIAIKWNVENECLKNKYEVERSANGIDFTGILSTNAVALTSGKAIYEKNDNNPLLADNYYRVKAYRASSQVIYSTIEKVVAYNTQPSIKVSPNPVKGNLIQLHFYNQEKGKYKIELISVSGQMKYRNIVELESGDITKSIIVNATPGNYHLSVISEKGTKLTQQIVLL